MLWQIVASTDSDGCGEFVSLVRSVTIFERDADKNRYATTVDLLHEKDARWALSANHNFSLQFA